MTQPPRIDPATQFAGEHDGFERLWTPHRMAYIQGNSETKNTSQPHTAKENDCPFCKGPTKTDEEALIVYRGKHCFAILNLFPYNPGHLLICPYRHIPMYIDLNDEELDEFTSMTRQAIRMMQRVNTPHGFNIGMNQGAVAGAGVAAHLHQHIVPRWSGDANFFPIIGRTKALPVLLDDTRRMFTQGWTDTTQ
ncbi:HIT family protein [Dermatophilus congolensis]|uniref:HIT family protein n=1 Tax=Dermatophilus congolensis TaxID=1863 RepID=UPI001AAFA55D|nr:HIT domain-containing protein [Dermatophilus congolensis]MBO3142767.1 HIT domain-containing protein [Dermatophilus congolensis]MBO3151759.1 HIT domain-containing protein [Dermatophilus congolensis]MBO3161239.1 HIT domain-containing protein [Dermatophilus congolensis]MBO3163041.1 HIT domain-containing protein [Dermatophilus congolensis]MBO3176593.1 HIT domain-containing protein [Dermatophilus congolensis]